VGPALAPVADGFPPRDPVVWLRTIARISLTSLATGPLVYGAVRALRHEPVRIRDCLRHGFGRPAALVATALVFGALVGAGLLFYGVFGVVFSCTFAVAVPVAVVERCGPIPALRRSAALTRGDRWRILGVVLTVTLLWLPLGFAMTMLRLRGELPFRVALLLGPTLMADLVPAVLYRTLREARESASLEDIARVFE
jgi:hypothetical protein